MIEIGFSDGSTLMASGDLPDAVLSAVRSTCQKLNVEFSAVTSINVGKITYSQLQMQEVCLTLALQDALSVLRQYANAENWSGVSNRHRVVQRRWRGAGDAGNELALAAVARLQPYDLSCKGSVQ